MDGKNPIRAVRSTDQREEVQVVTEPTGSWRTLLLSVLAATGPSVVVIAIAFTVLGLEANSRLKELDASADYTRMAIGSMSGEITSLRNHLKDTTDAELIFLKVLVLNPKVKHDLAKEIATAVHHWSKVFKRDPDFTLAIIEIESNFNPKAVSSAGAEGLMQVMEHWKDIMGITGDLKGVDVNIRAGLMVYGFYEEMYRDMGLALAAYNRGPTMVDRDITHSRNPERNGYSNKVETAYERLKSMRMSAGL